MEINDLQREITEWADEIIPHRTSQKALIKMLGEISELFENPSDELEMADIAILMFDYFHLEGVDIVEAVRKKMAINRQREWEVDEKTGMLNHVKNK